MYAMCVFPSMVYPTPDVFVIEWQCKGKQVYKECECNIVINCKDKQGTDGLSIPQVPNQAW